MSTWTRTGPVVVEVDGSAENLRIVDYASGEALRSGAELVLVAPYSVRPSSGAPVSAPIRWEELDDPAISSGRWTIQTLGARLKQVGDLFAPATELEQDLPAL